MKLQTKLKKHRHLIGVTPDRELARIIGCSRATIWKYRQEHGIEAVPRQFPQSRRKDLSGVKHLIGVATDREVAKAAGCCTIVVRKYRQKHGIPTSKGIPSPFRRLKWAFGRIPDVTLARIVGYRGRDTTRAIHFSNSNRLPRLKIKDWAGVIFPRRFGDNTLTAHIDRSAYPYRPEVQCTQCERPIRNTIYRVKADPFARLCRGCYLTKFPPSTAPILGCQVVRFERTPCEPALHPPAVPATPTPKAAAPVAAPVAAPTQPVRRGKKASSARGRGGISKGEMTPENAAFAAMVLAATAKGWVLRNPLIQTQPKARRKAATQVICRMITAGIIEASTTWIGPAGSTPPPHARSLQAQVLELIAERPRSRRELSARFHRVDTILGHLSARGHIESVGGLWRLKARADRPARRDE